MSLGHGQLGLSDRLETFHGLMADGSSERKAYLELRLGKTINGPNDPDIWTLDSGSIFRTSITAASITYAGVIRAITAVETMAGTRSLTRVEQASDLAAGTWFYDDTAQVAGGSTNLYVWLSTGADPDTTTMVVHLLFTFATKGEVHPYFGAEKFLNADLDTWGGGNPTDWLEVGAGAVQETTIVLSGTSSAKIGSAAIGAGAFDGIEESKVGINGALYRVSGYYQTPLTGQAAEVEVRLRVGTTGAGVNRLLSDGRNLTSDAEGVRVRDTYGEWKRFVFDFVWTGATTAALKAGLFLKNTAGAARAGTLYVDRMSFKRIHRWTFFAPNLTAASIPEMEIRSQDNLFGPKSIAIGSVSVSDGDGELAKAFAGLLLFNKPAMVMFGGAFANGAEIYRDDWRSGFPAVTRRPEVTDQGITFELDDARTLTRILANADALRVADLPNMDRAAEGRPKALVFGETEDHYLKPNRVSVNANGYAYLEYLDPRAPVADGVDVDVPAAASLKVYPNNELADRNEQGYELTDFTNDIGLSLNKTRWEIKRDIRNYRYDRAGNDVGTKVSFVFDTELSLGPADLTANLDISGPAYKLAADLQAAMRTAVGGGDTATTVTYNETTHKFTVARSGGGAVLNLYMTSTNMNRAHRSGWKILGFDTRTDKTGAVTYTGDEATFTDPDVDHVIRIRSGGYRDDASGSICGTASVALNTPPAAASWLLQKQAYVPVANINAASFAAGRTQSLAEFGLIHKVISDGDVLKALGEFEQSGIANLVVDGDGVWHWKRHVASSAGAREFYDRDYLTWRMWKDPSMVHKAVRVYGDFNQSLGRHMTHANGSGVIDTGIPVKHGAEGVLEVPGDLEREYITGGTELIGNYFARLVGKEPRLVEFSARGRLVDLLVGDKIKLTRSRAFDTTGAITSLAFRITALRHNFLTGVSTCTACEDVAFLT